MSRLPAALVLAALPFAATAAPENFTIDPYHSYPNFSIDHLGVSTMYGRFNKMSGKIVLDRAGKTASLDLIIDAASIDTGDGDKGSRARSRDEHLRAADFFNVAEFPRITYKSTGVTWTGESPSAIDGNLTMLGVTKPVRLTVERFKCNPPSGNSKERCGGNATGKIKRSEFGMKTGIPSLGDELTLLIGVEALKD